MSQTPSFSTRPGPIQAPGVEYMESINYVTRNPNWMMNLVMPALCSLIPVIGGLIPLGYAIEAAGVLTVTGGRVYPDFDFNRFSAYLMRGLGGLVLGIVLGLVGTILLFIGLGLIGGVASLLGNDIGGGLFAIIAPLFVMAYVLVLQCLTLPLVFRAGLSNNIGEAFAFGWVIDFLKRCGKETLLSVLFSLVVGMLFTMLGMLACFVGIYPALVFTMLMQMHLMYQLHGLYVSRGGSPIPMAMEPDSPVTRYAQQAGSAGNAPPMPPSNNPYQPPRGPGKF